MPAYFPLFPWIPICFVFLGSLPVDLSVFPVSSYILPQLDLFGGTKMIAQSFVVLPGCSL